MTEKKEEKGIVTPQYEIGCGPRTDRECCLTDNGCRLEAHYYPTTGKFLYPGYCCDSDLD